MDSCCSNLLGTHASVSFFDSTNIEGYRKKLVERFAEIICIAEKKCDDCIHRYDSKIIVNYLGPAVKGGINWLELCMNHDQNHTYRIALGDQESTVPKEAQHITALEEIVQLLANPCVIPYACTSSLAMVLLRVLVEIPFQRGMSGAKRASSQVVLLNAFVTFQKRCPDTRSRLVDIFHSLPQLVPNFEAVKNYDCEPLNQLASSLRYLSKSCSNDRWFISSVIQCLLLALQSVDDADVKLQPQQNRDAKTNATNRCSFCHLLISVSPDITKTRRRTKFATLSNLHDTDFHSCHDVDSSEILQISRSKNISRNVEQSHLSAKQVMNMTTPERICECQQKDGSLFFRKAHKQTWTEFTKLPPNVVFLRSRLYQKIVSTFSLLKTLRTTRESPNRYTTIDHNAPTYDLDSSMMWLLQNITDSSYCHPQSPSRRLCMVLLADSIGTPGYTYITKRLWERYETHVLTSTSDGAYAAGLSLRVYSEIIVECSVFDDPNVCHEAVRSLVKYVLAVCHNLDQDSALVRASDTNTRYGKEGATCIATSSRKTAGDLKSIRPLLRCVSYILGRRSSILIKPYSNNAFQKFLAQLSLSFDDQDFWVSPDMPPTVREEILHTVQVLGVLSFFDRAESLEVAESVSAQESDQTGSCLEWPFSNVASLRNTHKRMGPHCGRKNILSVLRNNFENTNCSEFNSGSKSTQGRLPDERIVRVPIMKYLNSDVLLNIFSFLGYQRLVKLSGVSKEWRTLLESDVLWQQKYHSRYNTVDIAVAKSGNVKNTVGPWKVHFISKWQAERPIRFSRSHSGWKYRICGFVNCYSVLRSRDQLQKHYSVHRTNAQTAKKRRLRAEQKKRLRDAREVTKHILAKKKKREKATRDEKKLLAEENRRRKSAAKETKRKNSELDSSADKTATKKQVIREANDR